MCVRIWFKPWTCHERQSKRYPTLLIEQRRTGGRFCGYLSYSVSSLSLRLRLIIFGLAFISSVELSCFLGWGILEHFGWRIQWLSSTACLAAVVSWKYKQNGKLSKTEHRTTHKMRSDAQFVGISDKKSHDCQAFQSFQKPHVSQTN